MLPSPNNKKQNPNQIKNSESWILRLTTKKFLTIYNYKTYNKDSFFL